jgi:hypothetical protein
VSKSMTQQFARPRRLRSGRHITIIDKGVTSASVRRAKLGFFLALVLTALTVWVGARTITGPVAAVVIAVVSGLAAGSVVFVVAFCWPVIRAVWHWLFEITAGTAVLATYCLLTTVMHAWWALALILLALGGPFTFPPARKRVLALSWCVITRHRLRVCFSEFIKNSSGDGRLPLILTARPTPAGERVWVWLRSGLSFSDLEGRYDKVAVATWGTEVRATRHVKYAALVRVDITRRNTLGVTVTSPLSRLIPRQFTRDNNPVSPAEPPSSAVLDLPGVPDITSEPRPERPERPARKNNNNPSSASSAITDAGDDTADWI